MLVRTMFVMALCIICRCVTFLSTSLPGPAPHCQPESLEYHPPNNLKEIIFRVDAFKGCGDLIFSSHTSISLTLVCTYYVYCRLLLPKRIWQFILYCIYCPAQIILLCLIIAARKHYTVDVVVAVYSTILIYYASYYLISDKPENTNDFNDDESSEQKKDDDKEGETQHLVFKINSTNTERHTI